jgi:hypothetical protein
MVDVNAEARWLLGEWPGGANWSGSLLARLFLDPAWRDRFIDWQVVARSAVAQFRMTADMTDPVMSALVDELQAASPDFAAAWPARDVAEPPVWQKRIRHPQAGDLLYNFTTVRPEGRDSAFVISIYTPADGATLSSSILGWRA